MKKLITIVLLLALAVPGFAQDIEKFDFEASSESGGISYIDDIPAYRWTVKTTAGYLPTVPVLVDLFGAIFAGIAIGLNEDANETLDMQIPPYFGLEALYSFNDTWSLGLSTGYMGTVWSVVDKDTRAVHSSSTMTFIPVTIEGRCNYLDRPAVKLYGSLEAGALLCFSGDSSVTFDVQLNPIGVEFGRRFFGVVELGIGMNYTGVRGGIGYRF